MQSKGYVAPGKPMLSCESVALETLGERVDWLLEQRGISQNQLADMTDKKSSYISNLISRKTETVRENTLLALAKALRVSPTWLRTGQGDNSERTIDGLEYEESEDRRELVMSLREGDARVGVAAGALAPMAGQAKGGVSFSPWLEALNKAVVEQYPSKQFTYSQQMAAKFFIHLKHSEMAPGAKAEKFYAEALKAAKWLDEHEREPSPTAILEQMVVPDPEPVATPELEEARKQNEADNIPKATRRPR